MIPAVFIHFETAESRLRTNSLNGKLACVSAPSTMAKTNSWRSVCPTDRQSIAEMIVFWPTDRPTDRRFVPLVSFPYRRPFVPYLSSVLQRNVLSHTLCVTGEFRPTDECFVRQASFAPHMAVPRHNGHFAPQASFVLQTNILPMCSFCLTDG